MLTYTKHARDRMQEERKISKEEVEFVIHYFDLSFPGHDATNTRNYVATTPKGRRIRVVAEEKETGQTIVVSAMDCPMKEIARENQIR